MTIQEYLDYLRDSLWKPTDLINTPARDLTRAQAMEVVTWLLAWGKFTLANPGDLFAVGRDGTVAVRPGRKVFISPSRIEGVTFRYLTYIDRRGVKRTVVQNMAHLDPRNVVFLWKLARMLRMNYDADTIYHIGFMFEATRTDCHGQGRALDFAGAAGPEFDLTVAGDWTGQPVTLSNDYTDRATGRRYTAGTSLPDWPRAPFRDVYFRLDATQNPALDPARQPDLAADLFGAVYELAAEECTDTGNTADEPSAIGDRSFIMHPDHPASAPGTPHGREAHWQHMHMQIGPTGTEASPP